MKVEKQKIRNVEELKSKGFHLKHNEIKNLT